MFSGELAAGRQLSATDPAYVDALDLRRYFT
jgi:hypothetical protein